MAVDAPWKIILVSQALAPVLGLYAGLVGAGHQPVALVTSRRRREDTAVQHEQFADLVRHAPAELDILVPASRERMAALIRPLEPDLIVCSGFNWLIPREVLELPRFGAINLHPSLLPRYRGPIPVSWALRNADAEIGLTIHRMDDNFDTGPILAQGSAPLPEDVDDWPTLGPTLHSIAAQIMAGALERLAARDPGDPQDEASASYAGPFEEDYVWVDWTKPAREIYDQVRAWRFSATPATNGQRGPLAELDGETIRILKASLSPADEARLVKTGDGPLWLVETETVSTPDLAL
jgi:methionyl-tRNA formyltransferase